MSETELNGIAIRIGCLHLIGIGNTDHPLEGRRGGDHGRVINIGVHGGNGERRVRAGEDSIVDDELNDVRTRGVGLEGGDDGVRAGQLGMAADGDRKHGPVIA